MNERAEDFLLSKLFEIRRDSQSFGDIELDDDFEEFDGFDRAEEDRGVIDALAACGMLDAAEADHWAERLAKAEMVVAPEPSPENIDAANRHIDSLIDRRDAGEDLFIPVMAAWTAYSEAGLFREYDRANLFERLNRKALEAAAENLSPGTEVPLVRLSGNEPAVDGGDVRRVIAGPAQRQKGARVVVVESLTDCVVVRAQRVELVADYAGHVETLPDEVQPDEGVVSHLLATVTDDVGTEYSPVGGGGGSCGTRSGNTIEHFDMIFGPAIPENATRLQISIEDVEFEVAL